VTLEAGVAYPAAMEVGVMTDASFDARVPGGDIVWRLHLASPPERVFAFLDSDEGRASFWAEQAVERDGVIEFRFVNGMRDRATIVERDPPARFEIEYFGSRVMFELRPDGEGGTDLTVSNSGVAADRWYEVHAGWLNVLFPLKAAVDFGVDLRSHDPERTWQRGYVDQ
jgi:uncharacterized protein YndB with AHSA1/START domain